MMQETGAVEGGKIVEKEDDRVVIQGCLEVMKAEPNMWVFCCLWGDESFCYSCFMITLNTLTCCVGGCIFMCAKRCCCPTPPEIRQKHRDQLEIRCETKYIFSKVTKTKQSRSLNTTLGIIPPCETGEDLCRWPGGKFHRRTGVSITKYSKI